LGIARIIEQVAGWWIPPRGSDDDISASVGLIAREAAGHPSMSELGGHGVLLIADKGKQTVYRGALNKPPPPKAAMG
jgi:hypothetical protein